MNDTLITYFGKSIEDMTREELISALRHTATMLRNQQESHMRSWEIMGQIRRAALPADGRG